MKKFDRSFEMLLATFLNIVDEYSIFNDNPETIPFNNCYDLFTDFLKKHINEIVTFNVSIVDDLWFLDFIIDNESFRIALAEHPIYNDYTDEYE